MVSVGKLEPFEGGLQEWVSYVYHFEQFLVANDITEAKKVMAIFLTAVGAKTYELLKDTGAPAKPLELKFEEVVERLNKHYDPKSLVIAERFKFHKRNQQADESIAEYCAALRKYAWTCQFGTFLDEALRDRIVCGMKDPATQRRLLTESKLTLAKALEIAQGMEAAAKQAQQLTSEMSTPADRSTFKIDVMGKGRTRDTSRLVVGGILRNPDRTRTRTWTRTRRKPGLGKNPDSCSDSRLRNPDSTIENPDSKSKILDSMKLDSDNIRNKFSSLICFWVSFSNMLECLAMN